MDTLEAWKTFVSDIVLKRDVKLQLTGLENLEKSGNLKVMREK